MTTALQMLTPPPDLTVSQWADANRRLSSEASAEPGRWSTARAEYQRGIMDAVSDPDIETVVVMSSAQVGKTEVLNNTVGYHIDQDPAPIMVVMPTERDAETWSKDRFAPMARDTPCLTGRIADPKSRDGSNKILHKRFAGGHLTIVGANAPSGLASRPIRILLCDEVDRYPVSAGAEGDPVKLARKRTVTFWNRKIVLVSTPTLKGASRIETAFEESDRRRFWVPCPDCGQHQVLTWGQVRWDSEPEPRPDSARYVCIHCDAVWGDARRWQAIAKGEWRAEAPFTGIAGFHLNEIYSTWVRLADMVRTFLSAKAAGDEAMKTFVNTSLGETWQESGEAPDWQRLYERRGGYRFGTVPTGGLFLTAGADVQKDRIEVSVWAWGRGLTSWLVDHIVIEGGPERAEAWAALTVLLGRTWPHAHGSRLGLARLAIDTGYEAPAVYAWARSVGFAQVAPVKGVEGFNRAAPVAGPSYVDATENGRKVRRGARLWTVAVATFKSETYRFLRLARPTDEDLAAGITVPAGSLHLPQGVEAEWVKQLVAEQLVTVKTKRGFTKLDWQKLRERNEALDCRVYARAAAWIAGIDRWTEAKWRDLEDQVGPAPDASATPAPIMTAAEEPTAGQLQRPTTPGEKRRGGWLGGRNQGWLG
ncbi:MULTISPECIES: phage terminase large subunit family protein [unclassified Azospirillum]|uniref:phage terminase large subunit family protein n=1 Tax=unclassified Azospirillum TaxID=2630922 RepID=UPI001FCE2899|nr:MULTISPECIES: phage terminase large subunit family protein [unclassified Azospirillum]